MYETWSPLAVWLGKGAYELHFVSFSFLLLTQCRSSIRAWEWVDAIDIPAKIPYLFYELERGKKGRLRDTVFGGLPYRDYDTVPFQPGDPVPDRLSRLRRYMNEQARSLLYAEEVLDNEPRT